MRLMKLIVRIWPGSSLSWNAPAQTVSAWDLFATELCTATMSCIFPNRLLLCSVELRGKKESAGEKSELKTAPCGTRAI